MKTGKRIFYAILRNKQYIFYFLTVVIITQVLFFAIQSNVSNKRSIENMKESVGAKVIVAERMNFLEGEGLETISKETIKAMASMPEVKYYDYFSSFTLFNNNIERVKHINQESPHFRYDSFNIIGVQHVNIFESMKDDLALVAGRPFSEEDRKTDAAVALISSQLAKKNNIEIGDVLQMENRTYGVDASDKSEWNIKDEKILAQEEVDLEIIGLFENIQKASNMDNSRSFVQQLNDTKDNTFYVLNDEIDKLENATIEVGGEQQDSVSSEIVFELNSASDVDSFKEKIQKYLPDGYEIITAREVSETAMGMMNTSQDIMKIILIAGIICMIFIFSLITILLLNARQKEFGILYAIGLNRMKLTTQIVCELGIVTVLGFIPSLLLAKLVTTNYLKSFLLAQIKISENNGYDVSALQNLQLIDYVVVDMSWPAVLIIGAIFISVLIILSVLIHTYFKKISPKEILME